jgi:hypothetical protein
VRHCDDLRQHFYPSLTTTQFDIFPGCIGAVLVLFSLSTVCMIVHESLSLQQKSFRKKIDHLNDFIRRKRIPDPLAARACMQLFGVHLLCAVTLTLSDPTLHFALFFPVYPMQGQNFYIIMSICATATTFPWNLATQQCCGNFLQA